MLFCLVTVDVQFDRIGSKTISLFGTTGMDRTLFWQMEACSSVSPYIRTGTTAVK